MAAIEREAAAAAYERAICEICTLGEVPGMASAFIAHKSSPASVARALAACVGSRPC